MKKGTSKKETVSAAKKAAGTTVKKGTVSDVSKSTGAIPKGTRRDFNKCFDKVDKEAGIAPSTSKSAAKNSKNTRDISPPVFNLTPRRSAASEEMIDFASEIAKHLTRTFRPMLDASSNKTAARVQTLMSDKQAFVPDDNGKAILLKAGFDFPLNISEVFDDFCKLLSNEKVKKAAVSLINLFKN